LKWDSQSLSIRACVCTPRPRAGGTKAMGRAELSKELEGLAALDRTVLVGKWRRCYGTTPPPRIGPELMAYAIARRLQERALGGLAGSARRLLAQTARERSARKAVPSVSRIGAGTVLVREWHGVTYQVSISEEGVLFVGQRYRSLSEVARQITGTRWSGPRFFGLRASAKEHCNRTA
jgi:DUF2924 family protein